MSAQIYFLPGVGSLERREDTIEISPRPALRRRLEKAARIAAASLPEMIDILLMQAFASLEHKTIGELLAELNQDEA